MKMELIELYKLVLDFFGYKASDPFLDSGTLDVTCTLYDSFKFICGFDDQYGSFGGGVDVGHKGYITNFLGKRMSLNSDEKSIIESLQIVDDYCRLRLPEKFLEAYDRAYKNNGRVY
jgi:hypothetical protein